VVGQCQGGRPFFIFTVMGVCAVCLLLQFGNAVIDASLAIKGFG
jgi:hypothetical protein